MSSISDEIYKSIELKIINGELKAGDKLPSENELCKIWNTSRISVRQALERMVALGILKKVRGGGTYVSAADSTISLSPLLTFAIFREESIRDILIFRKVIDVGIVKICAVNRDEENLNRLRICLDDMEISLATEDRVKFNEADLEFHMEIARGSKNPLNVKVYEMLRHIIRKNQININVMLGISSSIKEHRNIYIAIEDNNPELAAHFMEKHIQRTINEMELVIQEK
ncbi:FadR/GntR family transcriptional regulator [Sporomusa sp.]|uniref:FadR/GntR family transcriptional regulator n=1 Tax=Sporomusa sp. TaxID=2078658 RepID=UPI002C4E7410|nr:FadR/GntR family transcriptional regulator [Sporomusa sp.]HWR44482.1 FadR/GntR family transcriptional regulator [Sporomusa sp.]